MNLVKVFLRLLKNKLTKGRVQNIKTKTKYNQLIDLISFCRESQLFRTQGAVPQCFPDGNVS